MTSIGTDRLTIIGLAMAAALPFLALSPVKAAPAAAAAFTDCAAQARVVLADAAAADPRAAAKAQRTVRTAEKICAAGNRHEAAKKFALARQQLGTAVQFAARR